MFWQPALAPISPPQKNQIETQAPPCGYCQSGHIIWAATLLKNYPNPSDTHIDAVTRGNLCRCMARVPMREAIKFTF